jgi:hypothetical protein
MDVMFGEGFVGKGKGRRLGRKIGGNTGKSVKGGKQGACGGTPKRDGSGQGVGNRGTSKQPPKKK